ncbi:MAG: ABC transporter substrate-binding protein [Gammaproteobacteria bacterium]|nr:ABC transporter substrate-binding protein [Gammaproteobacteria bacterium]MBU1442497.1 ABC transporter substrate-binding protein [Gammaproteobacteria bacterium]MBU2286635.1 ABC transporter substrate-binding protein [Gammaproteobacteria bacterium]MBU2409014.1 ABC transporter substrate-binding protein [Gammaproteobacteria bacterium]
MERRNLIRAVGAAALAAGLATSAVAQQKDKVTLLLNWYVYSEHAPFFIGKAKGFYEAEGIDLDIQEGRGSAVTIQAVAAKSATFGYADVPTMIKAATKGAPVKAVGVALQVSPMSVMGLAEKKIDKPQDIVGKTIAMTPGDSMSQIWPLFLKKTGLKEDQYKVVSGDGQTKLNAVINGQADLLLGYVMDQNIKIQDATKKPVHVIRFADYGVSLISSGIIAQKETLAEKPDLVRRFLRATTKAFEETEKNPEAAIDAMLAANSKAGQRDTLVVGIKLTTPLYHTAETKSLRPLRTSMKDVNESLDLLVQYGGLDASLRGKAEDWVTDDFLPK